MLDLFLIIWMTIRLPLIHTILYKFDAIWICVAKISTILQSNSLNYFVRLELFYVLYEQWAGHGECLIFVSGAIVIELQRLALQSNAIIIMSLPWALLVSGTAVSLGVPIVNIVSDTHRLFRFSHLFNTLICFRGIFCLPDRIFEAGFQRMHDKIVIRFFIKLAIYDSFEANYHLSWDQIWYLANKMLL